MEELHYKWLHDIAEANGVSASAVAQTLLQTIFKNEMRYKHKQPSAYKEKR